MKNLKSIIAIVLFLSVTIQFAHAQTTRVKTQRQMEAAESAELTYAVCSSCGFGVYVIKGANKRGLPIYHHFLKDFTNGTIRFDHSSPISDLVSHPDICTTLCSINNVNKN